SARVLCSPALGALCGSARGTPPMGGSGTLALLYSALDGLASPLSALYPARPCSALTTNDLGNTGSGGAQTATGSVAINVNAVNDAPVNNVPAPQTNNEDTPLAFSTANGNAISVTDVDANAASDQVTLSATPAALTLP